MSAAPSVHESAATAEAAQAGLLYERYARQIQSFCRARLRSPEEAEDAVQHTFLNAYRSLRQGTVPRAEAAWVYAIAANVCRERQRSAWRRSRVEVVSDDGLVADRAAPERTEDLGGIAGALSELTPNQRRAILLREWQGLSYREIAGELGVSEAAVETLLFRARRSLARMRGRVWGLSNLGSALAWIRTGLPGAAAPVAAATLAVTAGVTAAVPLLRDTPARQAPVRASHALLAPPVSFRPRPATAVKAAAPQQRLTTHEAIRRSRPRPAAAPPRVSPPAETPPAAAPPAAPPVTVAPPPPAVPPAPQAPPVEAPPLPTPAPLPAPPPLEPVNVPQLPSGGVQLPPPPPLP